MTNGFVPWTERKAQPPVELTGEAIRALVLAGKEPPEPRGKKRKWTMPWEEEHWRGVPEGIAPWLKGAWTGGLMGLGALGPGAITAPARALPILSRAPWLLRAMQPAAQHPIRAGLTTALPAYFLGQTPEGRGLEEGVPEGIMPGAPKPPTGVSPGLPEPEPGGRYAGKPFGKPQIVEVGGQTFWWNPTGGIEGTGGWDLIPTRPPTPTGYEAQPWQFTPEQQIAQMEAERQARIEQLKLQMALEQQSMTLQSRLSREAQSAQQAQASMLAMAQMYAAEPYKYWAQLGQETPGAVRSLLGGKQIAPGMEMSIPSAQWWGNLLPSEQEQIGGAVSWLGTSPADWYSMYQRMVPGLGARQVAPSWAR